jgi:hypothetical protein
MEHLDPALVNATMGQLIQGGQELQHNATEREDHGCAQFCQRRWVSLQCCQFLAEHDRYHQESVNVVFEMIEETLAKIRDGTMPPAELLSAHAMFQSLPQMLTPLQSLRRDEIGLHLKGLIQGSEAVVLLKQCFDESSRQLGADSEGQDFASMHKLSERDTRALEGNFDGDDWLSWDRVADGLKAISGDQKLWIASDRSTAEEFHLAQRVVPPAPIQTQGAPMSIGSGRQTPVSAPARVLCGQNSVPTPMAAPSFRQPTPDAVQAPGVDEFWVSYARPRDERCPSFYPGTGQSAH